MVLQGVAGLSGNAGKRQKVAGDKGGRVERGVEEAGQRRVCPDLPWGRPLG